MDKSALWLWTLILQGSALFRLVILLLDCLRSDQSFLAVAFRKYIAQIRKWWEQRHAVAPSSSELELDEMRCKWMRIVLRAMFLLFSVVRLLPWQIKYLQNLESETSDEFDLTVLVVATIAFIFGFLPYLINPRSQDIIYVVIMLGLDATYLMSGGVDVRDMMGFSFAGRLMFGALAKRTWCVVLCVVTNMLTAIQLYRSQADVHGPSYSVQIVASAYAMLFLCIIGVRILIRENVLLKVGLQKRTVEMGAVSSLLTASYDAVVEVDRELKLTHDSNQLSSMLLHAPKPGGLSGKPLLDFFSENDRSRISEQWLSSTRQNLSVVALNADMLDADFNHVKVELFGAQFTNLANEQCFLVAVREMQDLEPALQPPCARPTDSLILAGKPDVVVLYDVFTFDVYLVDRNMAQFCEASLKDLHPDNILDLASPDSRLSLSQQLQRLGNQLFISEEQPMENFAVNFELLGLGEATASVSVEHDQVLDSWTGTMAIYLKAAPLRSSLTASNLQRLPTDGGGHSFLSRRPSTRSSPSRRSSLRSGGSSQRSGAIRELHQLGRSIPL